jgi:hypothetical protein
MAHFLLLVFILVVLCMDVVFFILELRLFISLSGYSLFFAICKIVFISWCFSSFDNGRLCSLFKRICMLLIHVLLDGLIYSVLWYQ